jgi:hypothetical protein
LTDLLYISKAITLLMTALENQVIETWRIHNRITIFVIEHIPDEALKTTLSKRGGRDIGRQFAHMNAIRVWQLKPTAKKLHMPLTGFPKDESPEKNFCSRPLNNQAW